MAGEAPEQRIFRLQKEVQSHGESYVHLYPDEGQWRATHFVVFDDTSPIIGIRRFDIRHIEAVYGYAGGMGTDLPASAWALGKGLDRRHEVSFEFGCDDPLTLVLVAIPPDRPYSNLQARFHAVLYATKIVEPDGEKGIQQPFNERVRRALVGSPPHLGPPPPGDTPVPAEESKKEPLAGACHMCGATEGNPCFGTKNGEPHKERR